VHERRRFLVPFLLTATLVVACGDSTPEIRAVDDPAMRPPARALAASTETVAAPPVEPTTLQYDASRDRIFVPGTGWLDAAELWDNYVNDPDKLPEGLELSALHALGPPAKAQEELANSQ